MPLSGGVGPKADAERLVLALDRVRREERLEVVMGAVGLRGDEQPARVLVDAVDDPRPLRAPHT